MTFKYETVVIARQGLSILHTEGGDFSAKGTYHRWIPGTSRVEIVSERLFPRYGHWE